MIFFKLLTFLSFINFGTSINCNINSDTLVVNNNNDLNEYYNCTKLNGNLFINGGYDLTNLHQLDNLETIDGYLFIFNSYKLKTLKYLHNLQNITGNTKYLNQYSVYINDNYDSISNIELCNVNTINWNNIVKSGLIYLNNNNLISNSNCPTCDSECINCWGGGPRLCHECKKFISGRTCVHTCLNDTYSITDRCIENNPDVIMVSYCSDFTSTSFKIQWKEPIKSNGVIIGYDILYNNMTISSQRIIDQGYTYSNDLLTYYNVYNLNPYEVYTYYLRSINNMGFSNYSAFECRTLSNKPSNIQSISVKEPIINLLRINWTIPNYINGPNLTFILNIDNNNENYNLTTTYNFYEISNVYSGIEYFFSIKAYNSFYYSNTLYTNYTIPIRTPPLPHNLSIIQDIFVLNVTFGEVSEINGPIILNELYVIYNNIHIKLANSTNLNIIINLQDYDYLFNKLNIFYQKSFTHQDLFSNGNNVLYFVEYITPTTISSTISDTLTSTHTLTSVTSIPLITSTTTNNNLLIIDNDKDSDEDLILIIILVCVGISLIFLAILFYYKFYKRIINKVDTDNVDSNYRKPGRVEMNNIPELIPMNMMRSKT